MVSGVAGGEEGGAASSTRTECRQAIALGAFTRFQRGEKESERGLARWPSKRLWCHVADRLVRCHADLQYWTVGNRSRLHRRTSGGRQPVHQQRRRAGFQDTGNEVVRPVHAARYARLGCECASGAGDEVWQGRLRKLIFHADRNGFFYVFDRTNGEVLMHEPIVGKQNWNLGFTKDGRPIIDPGSVSTRDGVAVCPASGGGTNWPAVSYNPIARLFYFRVSDSCGIYTSHHDPLGVSGNRWFGRGTPANPRRHKGADACRPVIQTGRSSERLDRSPQEGGDYPAPPGRSGGCRPPVTGVSGGGVVDGPGREGRKTVWHSLGQTLSRLP